MELALARAKISPREHFQAVAELCEKYNIDKFDVYGDFPSTAEASWLRKFERDVAQRLGKEDALFVVSGTMGQSIAAKIHEAAAGYRTKNLVCHYTSHVMLHEQNSYPTLLNLTPVAVEPDATAENLEPLKYSDVAPLLDQDPAPFMVMLECPHREIGGVCTSWEDLVLISEHCKARGVAFHCDGARLWEAEAEYIREDSTRTIQDLVGLFDSVYVSFYKGLGGITGSMLLGNARFISEARIWSRRFGGNLFCQLPLGLSCIDGFHTFGLSAFRERRSRMQHVVSLLTKLFENPTHSIQGRSLVNFVPRVPQVSVIHVYINVPKETAVAARDHVVATVGISCFTNIRSLSTHSVARYRPDFNDEKCYFEMNMGPSNMLIEDENWLKGWKCFVDYVQANR